MPPVLADPPAASASAVAEEAVVETEPFLDCDGDVIDDDTQPMFEIVNGERIYQPMSALAQQVGSRIDRKIGPFAEDHQLGVAATEVYIACFPWDQSRKRRPDVAFWSIEKYPTGALPARGVARKVPDLCVEVVSPEDKASDLRTKVNDYFRAGVRVVWTVDPEARVVQAEQADGTAHVYSADDTITGEPVLPGFEAKVASFFPAPAESK
jgi:Uma2 family endonuclease